MVKIPMKTLSLMIAAALALVLLLGMPSTTSEGATTHTINAPADWAAHGTTINMGDGDILNISAAAGSPSSDTVINIAANANVTITGAGNLINNLRIVESSSDTQVHTVTLQNLKIKANAAEGYIHYMGSLRLTGANEISGDNACGIYSVDATKTLTITSTNNGTLTAKGGSQNGIYTSKLSIQGSARVTAAADGSATSGVLLFGGSPSVNVGADAMLTATGDVNGNGIQNGTASLVVTCNGTIGVNAPNYGIYTLGPLAITGSGALNLIMTGATSVGIQASTLSISGVGVLADSPNGISLSGTTDIILTDGATLNTKNVIVGAGKGFTMSPGTTIYYTNNTAASKNLPYTMSSAGNQWILTDATFVTPSTLTSSSATLAVAAGATGTIKLASQPGMIGPATGTLTAGYSAMAETTEFTLTGNPTPVVTKVSGDPKITWNATANKINVATGLAAGTYAAVFSASNGYTPATTFTYTLTVNAPSGITDVTVTPATADVQKGSTRTFTAAVTGTGTPAQTVTWSVTGNTDADTKISSAGVLTVAAGETATTLTVKATSTVDTGKSGTATVTVKEPSGGGGGGDNTILWVAVGAVIAIAAIGAVFFLFIRKP